MNYTDFIAAKAVAAPRTGFDVEPHEVNPILKPHQADMVRWAVAGGRRALKLGRRAHDSELSPRYWADSVLYARQAEVTDVPTLFDLEPVEAA